MNGWPEFHRLADRELNEAAQYYELESPGLGAAFLNEVERCLGLIVTYPEPGWSLWGPCVDAFFGGFPTRSYTRSGPTVSAYSRS